MAAPKKYVKVDGVMKMNPEYKIWKEAQSGSAGSGGSAAALPATTVADPATALPVVSNMEDHMQLNEDLGHDVPLSESTNATIEMMQEPEISIEAGMQPDEMVDELGAVLAKHEVPMGLMNKLMMLSEFQRLEFMIDDSGSMRCLSDALDPVTKKPMSRWEEARSRLKEMIEILAYVPFQQIVIAFLNRNDTVQLERAGRDPKTFLTAAYQRIDAVFRKGPAGTTPAREKIEESFRNGKGMSVARYFFGDGVPNGVGSKEQIITFLKNRANPDQNPITFLSCTNEDEQVEWMKHAEEIAPYCSESDDFVDEAAEVLRDQGAALPYTKGFHLICQLVAAMNPDDLDAMDESVPFTKATLDNLLGIESNEESYRHYFDNFVMAQRNRTIDGPADQIKKNVQWKYDDFVSAPVANRIPQVQQFKKQLASV